MIKTIRRRKHTHENSYSPRQCSSETWKYPLEGYFSPFTSKEKFGLGRRKGNGNTLGIQREFVRKRAVEENGAPRALQQWAEGLLPLGSSIVGSSEHVTVTCVTCCRSTLEWKGVVREGWISQSCIWDKQEVYSFISLRKTELCRLGKHTFSQWLWYSQMIYSVGTHKLYNKISPSCIVRHFS